jgi:hypothetical protein
VAGLLHRGYTSRPSVSNHSLVEFHRRVKKMPWSKLVAVSLDALDSAASDMQQWEMTFSEYLAWSDWLDIREMVTPLLL